MYPYVRKKSRPKHKSVAAALKATVPSATAAIPVTAVPPRTAVPAVPPKTAVPAGPPAGETPTPPPTRQPTLRQRYTFLDEPDCPPELHALVGHRISQYNLYVKLYAQLRDCESLTALSDVCGKLIDAYIDNRQCTEELDYYQQHRKLLGKHPILKHLRQLTDLRCKTTRELMEEQRRTQDNIWRAKSEIAKGTKPHLNQSREERIRMYEMKLKEINRLLAL